MISRRVFLNTAIFAAGGYGQEITSGDASIMFLPGTRPDEFGIAVKSPVECDLVRVTVFYEITVDGRKLLLSEESLAPFAGPVYGATNRNFSRFKKTDIKYVDLTFLREVGMRQKVTP